MSKTNKTQAQVFHFDLYGKREEKSDFLNENSLKCIFGNELNYNAPQIAREFFIGGYQPAQKWLKDPRAGLYPMKIFCIIRRSS